MERLTETNPIPLKGGPTLRWGILAPGVIATKFVRSLQRHTDQPVVAVGSRSEEKAKAFADEFSIPRSFGSYEGVLEDDNVDAVYIASPHSHHASMAIAALDAGKHALIEKPIATSAAEARAIKDASQRTGCFAMEAMHTRFHPKTHVLAEIMASDRLGDVAMVSAEAGAVFPVIHDSRIYDPALGGGALLDMGVYSLWFLNFVMGAPNLVQATGTLTETGVDSESTTVVINESGQVGTASCSLHTLNSGIACVNGSEGRVEVKSRFGAPGDLVVYDGSNRPVAEFIDDSGLVTPEDGLCRQAAWAARHVSEGLSESPLHPLSASIEVLEVIDQARAQLGAAPIG